VLKSYAALQSRQVKKSISKDLTLVAKAGDRIAFSRRMELDATGSPPMVPGQAHSGAAAGKSYKSYKTLVDENFYTREAADNLVLGCPQLRRLLDDGFLRLGDGGINVNYPFRTPEDVRRETHHAFKANVPFFGFKCVLYRYDRILQQIEKHTYIVTSCSDTVCRHARTL
jgi:hypothetical protein